MSADRLKELLDDREFVDLEYPPGEDVMEGLLASVGLKHRTKDFLYEELTVEILGSMASSDNNWHDSMKELGVDPDDAAALQLALLHPAAAKPAPKPAAPARTRSCWTAAG